MLALNGVSVQLTAGKSLGVVGESGSGKSTFARAVMALETPTSGSVRLLGRDLHRLPAGELRRARRDFQMVFQDPYGSLDPRQTVARIVAEPLTALGRVDRAEQRGRVAAVLKQVGLRDADMDKYPHEFSGGQRQRIAIARALITQPKLIVADEPVSALDVSVQAQVLNLLEDLQDEFGLSYVLISHDLAVVEYLCDEIAVIYLGRIVEQGRPEDLFSRCAHPYTRALLEAVPRTRPGRERQRRGCAGDRVAIEGVNGLRLCRAMPVRRRALPRGRAAGAQRRNRPLLPPVTTPRPSWRCLPWQARRDSLMRLIVRLTCPFDSSRFRSVCMSRKLVLLAAAALTALSLLPQTGFGAGQERQCRDGHDAGAARPRPDQRGRRGDCRGHALQCLRDADQGEGRRLGRATARRKLGNRAGPEDLHLQAAQGRDVPERRTVQRGDGEVLL